MKKLLFVLTATVMAMLAMNSCKSGCGCHGDPFGELQSQEQTEYMG